MSKYTRPFESLDRLNDILAPYQAIKIQLGSALEPYRRLQRQTNSILRSQFRVHDQIVSALEPYRQLQTRMNSIFATHFRPQVQVDRILEPFNEYLSNPLIDSLTIDSGGSVTVDEEVIDAQIIRENIEKITTGYLEIDDFIQNSFSVLEGLRENVRLAVIYIIIPIIVSVYANIVTPKFENFWVNHHGTSQREVRKNIVREANTLYSREDLKDYRFVSTSILNVRLMGNSKSEIIDEIYLGKTVKLLKKSKGWSLIEYEDEDVGEVIQGWVFSRYLEKFTR